MVVVLMGVCGSGKTTIGRLLAETLGWSFADGDDFHPQANVEKMRSGIPLTEADRGPWLDSLARAIGGWISDETPTVLACSALSADSRRCLRVDSQAVTFVHLHGDQALIAERLAQRQGHFMPQDLLQSQFEALEMPATALQVDIRSEPAAIVQDIRNQLGV
jgi:gluconokinase